MPPPALPKGLHVTSEAFGHGQPIPRAHTCQGPDRSPPLAITGIPAGARCLALIMDDPDVPGRVFTHWTFWDLPAEVSILRAGADMAPKGAVEGRNDFGRTGYRGPCPPGGTHRYFLRAYALAGPLGLEKGAHRSELEKAMEGRVLSWGELMGTYGKA